ncbi:Lcl domain-containing protein [Poseidonibacter lekithochrous]|uniref:Lcl domain-containing protein n=1 Tax=Poseidonibacter lekithochrous TaxID=1904463 RepID=UPI000D376876|nr:DUF1566 domain-containing protein [Poseidonibacter lekithochrous]
MLLSKTSFFISTFSILALANTNQTYTVMDTSQKSFFNDKTFIQSPKINEAFYGQDATYIGNKVIYKDNKNSTIIDIQTGLIWQKTYTEKLSFNDAVKYAKEARIGGFNDWRIPTVKELYSLIDFNGKTGTSRNKNNVVPSDAKPYINTDYFDFEYSNDRRYIDVQFWTSTDYTSTTMNGNETFFGVNFADGRIKGYPKYSVNSKVPGKYYLRLVRGNTKYGKNKFIDKNNGTIYDEATTLTWTKNDSGPYNWKDSLAYCENLNYAGISTWRLPNAKELQSIVDYSKSPNATSSASINDIFKSTKIKNENNSIDYGYYWSSTTHLDGKDLGANAVYLSFGRALGYMNDRRLNIRSLVDVHGSGAQRSDPKSGSKMKFSKGRGPQGDVVRIYNFARCVSDNYTKVNTKRTFVKALNENVPIIRGNDNMKAIKFFDRNNDSKISYKEAPKRMQENFSRHDLNDDGFIDSNEARTLPRKNKR